MFVYDKTFDPKVVLGHCDMITWFSVFVFYLGILWHMNIFFFSLIIFAYDKTLDQKVFLGHCDLISCFSDFALCLDTRYIFIRLYYFELV